MTNNRKFTGIVVLIAAIGMMAGLVGAEIKDLESWQYINTPPFIGKSLIHLASVIASFVAGQLVPTMNKLKGDDE